MQNEQAKKTCSPTFFLFDRPSSFSMQGSPSSNQDIQLKVITIITTFRHFGFATSRHYFAIFFCLVVGQRFNACHLPPQPNAATVLPPTGGLFSAGKPWPAPAQAQARATLTAAWPQPVPLQLPAGRVPAAALRAGDGRPGAQQQPAPAARLGPRPRPGPRVGAGLPVGATAHSISVF